jgi:nicotinamide mononucleotide transporter
MHYYDIVLNWIFINYIEIIATITGLIYLVFSIKGDVLLWFFGIITSLLYMYVFFKSKIYADMGINLYYVVVSIYGWIHWQKNKSGNKKDLPFSKLDYKNSLVLLVVTTLIFVFIAYILKEFTDSNIVFWDAFITASSITATWMLARKIIEHWILWVVVDGLSIGLYIYKGLYPTVILFLVYTTLAVYGYFEWKKLWKVQENG